MLPELTSTFDRSAMLRLRARHDEIAVTNPELRPTLAPWIDGPLLNLHRGHAWLVAPAERDPLMTSDGRHVIPTRPLMELRRVAATRARFDNFAIAHELNTEGPVRHLVPLLAYGPRMCTDQVARQLVDPVPPHPGVAKLALVMEAFAGGIVRVTSVGPAAREAVARFVGDPIIFGVAGGHGIPAVGETALWYALTAWEW